jgi:hypothetical protein
MYCEKYLRKEDSIVPFGLVRVFSANKSGEYYGFARMVSTTFTNLVEFEPTVKETDFDAGRKSPTPTTEFAPKGHIVDVSARGTIFWEADSSDVEGEEEYKTNEAAQKDPTLCTSQRCF